MTTEHAAGATGPLSPTELERINAYWRAANYLSVAQIYLLDNPLLRRPLSREDVKRRLLGHWGTTPGLNFLYAHFNRAIVERDLNAIYIAGPGHGGPGLVANAYLDHTYTEVYPAISRDEGGLRRLCKQFSFPGGIPSHVSPECPGSIHEGGELGLLVVPRLRFGVRQPRSSRSRWSATVRPRPGRWPPAGTARSSSTRSPTASCCPSCTSTATRSPTPPCWPGFLHDELADLMRRLRPHARSSWTVTIRRTCTSSWPRPWTGIDEIAAIQRRGARGRCDRNGRGGR